MCVYVGWLSLWNSLWPWFRVKGEGEGQLPAPESAHFWKSEVLARSSNVNSQWSRLCPFSLLSFQRGKWRAFVALAFGEIK